jgi:hypothetical protein
MDKVQKPSNSECYTPSSEPFRIYRKVFIGAQPRLRKLELTVPRHQAQRSVVEERILDLVQRNPFTGCLTSSRARKNIRNEDV